MLAAVAALNYSVDVAGEWHASARGIPLPPTGQTTPVPENFNERMLRAEMVKAAGQVDIVVLGSSRAYGFSSAHFDPALRMLNLSMSRSVFRDFFGLWRTLVDSRKKPSTLILLVDPWMFNAPGNAENFRWKEFALRVAQFEADYFQAGSMPPWLPSSTFLQRLRWKADSWAGLLNWELFLQSGKAVWNKDSSGDASPSQRRLRADGSYSLPPPAVFDFAVERKRIDNDPTLMKVWELDEDSIHQLAALVETVEKSGVKPVVIVGPFHPKLYGALKENSTGVLSGTEKALNGLSALLPNFQAVCNGLNPEKSGCGDEDFSDLLHFSPECVTRLLRFCGVTIEGLNGILRR